MDRPHSRPPSRDMFYPPTLHLSDENAYLSHVGLVVLINGSPSADLPRQIARKLHSVHGGRQSDYAISQAAITPYLVTCPNTHVRDLLVQRGRYTIENTGVQFTIHEWRPRFGMGFEPPTHQLWVQLLGLPLQAWTTHKTTEVLQHFGHPLHILPFGRDAGHYRDVTALIATTDPSRIPISFSYREGDYTAKVEIHILRWRFSESGYFPPPDDPQCSQSNNDLNQGRSDYPGQQHNLSASLTSSSEAYSEPTIDLSSWSPRSSSAISAKLRSPNPSVPLLAIGPHPHQHRSAISHLLNTQINSIPHETQPEHITLCTGNLDLDFPALTRIPMRNPTKSFPLLSVTLLTIPAPIAATTSLSLQIVRFQLSARNDVSADQYLAVVASPFRHQMENLKTGARKDAFIAASSVQSSICMEYGPQEKLTLIQPSPNEVVTPIPTQSQAQPVLHQVQARPRCYSLGTQCHTAGHTPLQHFSILTATLPQSPTDPSPLLNNFIPSGLTSHPSTPAQRYPQGSDQEVLPDTVNLHLTSEPLSSNPTQAPKNSTHVHVRSHKLRNQPIRRSPRLQQRNQSANITANLAPKPTAKTKNIPFQLHSGHQPLDAATAVQIMEATGLQITEHVLKLIDEAADRDKANDASELSPPSTPLHDLRPPLAIPGEELLL